MADLREEKVFKIDKGHTMNLGSVCGSYGIYQVE